MKRSAGLVLAMVLALSFVGAGIAAEHPTEHPTEQPTTKKEKAKEHPKEHPTKKQTKKIEASISMEDLAKSIEGYVAKDAALKGGYFLVYDPESKSTLQLTLDHVHKERLSKVSSDVYFACADFKTPEGKIYDMDVFMKGNKTDSLEVTEVSVHKEDGKARYSWFEENGIWKKK
ncbi:MAG: hypothetical protein HYT97_02540 [Elusimicrobia bacterium]|nr:hypothetical protein [Elusimicrobiota bacterium]